MQTPCGIDRQNQNRVRSTAADLHRSGIVIEPEQLAELNSAPEQPGDYVLYWMQQSQRAECNPALEVAIAEANRLGLPLLVGFSLTEDYPEANARHYAFMLEGLAETERALRARGLGFAIRRGRPDRVILGFAQRAALIVADCGYLRPQREWRREVAAKAGRRFLQVEGDVLVPVGAASTMAEPSARTLRPKLERLRDRYLHRTQRTPLRVRAESINVENEVDLSHVPTLLASLKIDHGVAPVARFRGGSSEAKRRLEAFVEHRLSTYVANRSQPGTADVSELSPYLHFGQISPVDIAVAVREAKAARENHVSYLDELLVRRELAANFVTFTPNYDQYGCLPAWARQTLAAHQRDRREHVYNFEQFARAETHDPYWNAATREMLVTGYMHNYMRMYWGKKVLEWSRSPEQGYATLLRLNNTFFLDGRDMNSFANVGWVFGLHDRPWPERPIFGKVRSMTSGGLQRKTDIDRYVQKMANLPESSDLFDER
jgi:deoxyribodipyrimidine photo-lyase